MGRLPIEPSPALAQLLKSRREQMGLTLREVQDRSRALGRPIPFSTLVRVEQGAIDPGIRRLRVLFRIYDLAPRLLDDLLDLEEFSGEWPQETDPTAIYDAGVKLWKAGELRQSLAHLFALRGLDSKNATERLECQRGLLFFAIAVGAVGKFNLSRQIVDELLLEPPDESLMVNVLVQQAQCWNSLGSPVASLAFLSQAEAHLKEGDDQARGWVSHLRANVLLSQNRIEEAETEIEKGVNSYRRATDIHGESRSFAVRFKIMIAKSDYRGALRIIKEGREHAERHNYKRLVIQRRIEEGRALGLLGDEAVAITALKHALAQAITAEDEAMQFYAHYYLWKAYDRIGDSERANFERGTASFLVRRVDEITPEANEARQLSGTKNGERHHIRRARRR